MQKVLKNISGTAKKKKWTWLTDRKVVMRFLNFESRDKCVKRVNIEQMASLSEVVNENSDTEY